MYALMHTYICVYKFPEDEHCGSTVSAELYVKKVM